MNPGLGGALFLAAAACAAAAGGSRPAATAPAPRQEASTHEIEIEAPVSFTEREVRRILKHSSLGPPPPDPTNRWADDERAARLGQALFFDTRFSSNGEIACVTCHDPKLGFADGKPVAEGLDVGTRNSPTVWNVAYQRWFFLDGRADSLWAQAVQPFENEAEMGGNRVRIARTLAADAELGAAYEALFGPLPPVADGARFPQDARPVSGGPDDRKHPQDVAWRAMAAEDREAVTRVLVNVAKAIAAYERKLVSTESPFDRFARGLRDGDAALQSALSPAAQRGLKVFLGPGRCELCHSGPRFTDDEFHDLGLAPREGGRRRDSGRHAGLELLKEDPFRASGPYSDAPDGAAARELEFLVRTQEAWGQFKTPSLRNVAVTAPYAHDGKFERLADVVRFYSTLEGSAPVGHHGEQVLEARNFTEGEMADLVAFLESLTDEELPAHLLVPPASVGD